MNRCLVIAFGLATAPFANPNESASAQGIETVDTNSIRRGAEVARFCFKQSGREQSNCLMSALDKMAMTGDYIRLGFSYYAFVARSIATEAMDRYPAPGDRELKEIDRKLVKLNYEDLHYYEQKLFVSLHDLCAITQTDCAMAERFEHVWGARK
jgi:hypothetical protein